MLLFRFFDHKCIYFLVYFVCAFEISIFLRLLLPHQILVWRSLSLFLFHHLAVSNLRFHCIFLNILDYKKKKPLIRIFVLTKQVYLHVHRIQSHIYEICIIQLHVQKYMIYRQTLYRGLLHIFIYNEVSQLFISCIRIQD